MSDERLCVASTLLLVKARSKVRVAFEVSAAVGGAGKDGGLALSTTVEPRVETVYGEAYNEKKMTEFVAKEVGGGFEGWEGVVRELREKLVARGVKGVRK